MKSTVMSDYEWPNWHRVVKCQWKSCYAGMGLAGNGVCFAGGDFKQADCPEYKNEEGWLKREEK